VQTNQALFTIGMQALQGMRVFVKAHTERTDELFLCKTDTIRRSCCSSLRVATTSVWYRELLIVIHIPIGVNG
jgi:hypothetical protein